MRDHSYVRGLGLDGQYVVRDHSVSLESPSGNVVRPFLIDRSVGPQLSVGPRLTCSVQTPLGPSTPHSAPDPTLPCPTACLLGFPDDRDLISRLGKREYGSTIRPPCHICPTVLGGYDDVLAPTSPHTRRKNLPRPTGNDRYPNGDSETGF